MRVKLRIKLLGEDNLNIETEGLKINNQIKYLENDLKVIITYSNNKVVIKRSNLEYQITLNLEKNNNTISTYEFVGGHKVFNLNTYTSELLISDKKILVKYNLEGNDFKFILEVIE